MAKQTFPDFFSIHLPRTIHFLFTFPRHAGKGENIKSMNIIQKSLLTQKVVVFTGKCFVYADEKRKMKSER